MNLQEFYAKLGAKCRKRQSKCEGCDFRIFCYTPPAGQSQESVALVERLLSEEVNKMTKEETQAGVARLEKALSDFVERVAAGASTSTSTEVAALPAVAEVLATIYQTF